MLRRGFLRSAGGICGLAAIGGATALLQSCAGAGAITIEPHNNALAVPLTMFNNSALNIVRPAGGAYELAVEKKADGTFTALLLRCTHASNPLTTSGGGYACPLHGSRFDGDGEVTRGPAEQPLTRYAAEIKGENVVIHLH